jgi:hypothetical protein
MSTAWAAIVVTVVLLLPGVGFFAGYWAQERYSREIVKSTAIGEVGFALFFALLIHLLAWWALSRFWSFDPAFHFAPLAEHADTPNWLIMRQITARLWGVLLYIIATTAVGFIIGLFVGWMVMFGWFRFLATHKWAYDLIKEKNSGIVRTYLMTNIAENNRVLMYTGHLEEFYLVRMDASPTSS